MSANKKPRLMQKYRSSYEKDWPGIKPSRNGDNFAFCSVCNSDINVSHGGSSDIKRHMNTTRHKNALSSKSASMSINSYLTSKESNNNSTINAECLFVKFLVEHNIPLSAADQAGNLFRNMFPDFTIAKEYGSARTKTTAISNCFGEDLSKSLAEKIRSVPYSLSTDGSNDSGSETLYPIVIRYYNEDLGKVLTLASCKTSSTGENIFKLIIKELEQRSLSWSNCVSFGCDNASVMVGLHRGVGAYITKENPNVQIQGCPCHLLHIAAKNGTKQLSVDIELALIDIYHYFDKSTKRQQKFVDFLNETGSAVTKILKHGPTRWLSLERCIIRLLEQWEAFEAYFASCDESHARPQRIKAFFNNPFSKAYVLFLKKSLPLFVESNPFLQKEEPLLHAMQSTILDIVTTIAVRFIKPKHIHEATNLLKLDFGNKKLHKHRDNVVIGFETKDYLEKLKSENKMRTNSETIFFNDIRSFYAEAATYIVNKLPVSSELLAHAGILVPSKRLDYTFSSLKVFIDSIPIVKPPSDTLDKLEEEFLSFQVEKVDPEILECQRVDEAWASISQIKSVDGKAKCSNLARAMLAIAVIPHTNADCEQIFSMVKKCKTEFRSSMSTKVLSNLIIQKVHLHSRKEVCYQFQFSSKQLSEAKSACSTKLLARGSHLK